MSVRSAFLWAGAWMALGYAAGNALERVRGHAEQFGKAFALALGVVIAGYVVFKWIQRQRVSAQPEDRSRVGGGAQGPYAIPGAVRIAAEDLEQRHPDLPRDREIVLYCS